MLGDITTSPSLGGWILKMRKANTLPQVLVSAFYNLLGNRTGATYIPVYYVAEQVVNGINYKLIAECDKLVSKGVHEKNLVVVTIYVPTGSVEGKGARLVSEEGVHDFVLRDDIETGVKKALATLNGTSNIPLVEVGSQVVKGINYYFLCESKVLYPDAEPYLTKIAINNFQDNWTVVEIAKLS